MATFDFLLLTGSLCGIMMVLGGILLLYKGAISLNNASNEEAFTVEFKKELRISTQYPALGIFVIGLLFVAFSAWQGKPQVQKVVLKANVPGVLEPVAIKLEAGSWISKFTYQGNIQETFYPNMDSFHVILSAPGYEEHKKTVQVTSLSNGFIDLGDVQMRQEVSEAELSRNGIIKETPAVLNTAQGMKINQFGAAR